MVEIALRYLITLSLELAWHESLPALQFAFMNLRSMAFGVSPNKILYGHTTQDGLNVLDHYNGHIARDNQQTLFRLEAADALDFANEKTKLQYNRTHTPLEFNVRDRAYLRLHKSYALLNMPNRKLLN